MKMDTHDDDGKKGDELDMESLMATVSEDAGLLRRWPLDPVPVARARLPVDLDPAVVRAYQLLPEGEMDAFTADWTRRHPTARALARRALQVLADHPAAVAMEWLDAARALRPGFPETDWGEACIRARASAEKPAGPERTAEREKALAALARALQSGAATKGLARSEEFLSPLKDDPRFRALVGE